MSEQRAYLSNQRLRTPRAAAIAGIIFAVLYTMSFVLLQLSVPSILSDTGDWVAKQAGRISLALSLVPFAGIAFLWFMGVIRDRLGHLEDQFFSTLFLGSGLLYLAMTFVSAAIAGGILTVHAIDPELLVGSTAYTVARAVTRTISTVYAVRMAGMTMVVLGTIWVRTKLMPGWLVLTTYTLALVLLISIGLTYWVTLIFPAWVFLISVYILISNYRPREEN
jgi:hypothetical protein